MYNGNGHNFTTVINRKGLNARVTTTTCEGGEWGRDASF